MSTFRPLSFEELQKIQQEFEHKLVSEPPLILDEKLCDIFIAESKHLPEKKDQFFYVKKKIQKKSQRYIKKCQRWLQECEELSEIVQLALLNPEERDFFTTYLQQKEDFQRKEIKRLQNFPPPLILYIEQKILPSILKKPWHEKNTRDRRVTYQVSPEKRPKYSNHRPRRSVKEESLRKENRALLKELEFTRREMNKHKLQASLTLLQLEKSQKDLEQLQRLQTPPTPSECVKSVLEYFQKTPITTLKVDPEEEEEAYDPAHPSM